MISKVTLHTGPLRVASRSLGRFLTAQKATLAQQGVVYLPEIDVAGAFAEGTPAKQLAEAIKAGAGEAQHVVLLAPGVPVVEAAGYLKALAEELPLTVIRALRRQDDALESWLLSGAAACPPLEEILQEPQRILPWLDHARDVGALVQALGASALRLVVYDRLPRGPVAAYCELMGLPDTLCVEAAPTLNTRLSAPMAALLVQLQSEKLSCDKRSLLADVFARLSREEARAAVLLSASQRAALLERFADGNASLAREWFGTEQLFQSAMPAQDTPVSRLELPENSAAFLQEVIGPMMLKLSEGSYLGKR